MSFVEPFENTCDETSSAAPASQGRRPRLKIGLRPCCWIAFVIALLAWRVFEQREHQSLKSTLGPDGYERLFSAANLNPPQPDALDNVPPFVAPMGYGVTSYEYPASSHYEIGNPYVTPQTFPFPAGSVSP